MAEDMAGPLAQTYVSIRADLKTLDTELAKAKAATEATVARLQGEIESLSAKTAASIAGLAKKAQVDTGKAFLLMQMQGNEAMAGFAATVKKRMLESIEASNRARDSFREALNAGLAPGKTPLTELAPKATESKKALEDMGTEVSVSAKELKKLQYVGIAAAGGLGELGSGAAKVTNILTMMAFHGFEAVVAVLAVSTVAVLKAASAWAEYSASAKKAKEAAEATAASVNENALRRRDERGGTGFAGLLKAQGDLAKEEKKLREMEERVMVPFRERLIEGGHFNPAVGQAPISPEELKKRLAAAGRGTDLSKLTLEDLSMAVPQPLQAAVSSNVPFSGPHVPDLRKEITEQKAKVDELRVAMNEAGEDLRTTAIEQGKKFREAVDQADFEGSIAKLHPEFQRAAEKIRDVEKQADEMVKLSLDPKGQLMPGGVSREQADAWVKGEKDRISAEAVAKISAEDKAKADQKAAEALKERLAEEKKNAALAGEWKAQAVLERDLAAATDDLSRALLQNADAKRKALEQLGPNATAEQREMAELAFEMKAERLVADAEREAEEKRLEIRKEVDAELFDLTATDQQREQRQFLDHYTKLLELAEAYGVDVTALRAKIAAVAATIGTGKKDGAKGVNPATGEPWTEAEAKDRRHQLYESGMKQGDIEKQLASEGIAVDQAAEKWRGYGRAVTESIQALKAMARYRLEEAKAEMQRALFYKPYVSDVGITYGVTSAEGLRNIVLRAKAELDRATAGVQTVRAATGLSARVGGTGAPDSKLISMALSPGELLDVRKPGDARNTGPLVLVENHGAHIEEHELDGGRVLLRIEGALARRAVRGGVLGRTMLRLSGSRRKGVRR